MTKSLFIFLVSACLFSPLIGCGAGSLDFTEDLGNGYFFYKNSSIDQFIAPKKWNHQTAMIPSKVIKYEKQKWYIIAKREIIQKGDSGSRTGTNIFDYWILDASQKKVWGSMDKSEFKLQLKDLSIDSNLL